MDEMARFLQLENLGLHGELALVAHSHAPGQEGLGRVVMDRHPFLEIIDPRQDNAAVRLLCEQQCFTVSDPVLPFLSTALAFMRNESVRLVQAGTLSVQQAIDPGARNWHEKTDGIGQGWRGDCPPDHGVCPKAFSIIRRSLSPGTGGNVLSVASAG
jgi:hypothetical protein